MNRAAPQPQEDGRAARYTVVSAGGMVSATVAGAGGGAGEDAETDTDGDGEADDFDGFGVAFLVVAGLVGVSIFWTGAPVSESPVDCHRPDTSLMFEAVTVWPYTSEILTRNGPGPAPLSITQ